MTLKLTINWLIQWRTSSYSKPSHRLQVSIWQSYHFQAKSLFLPLSGWCYNQFTQVRSYARNITY